MRFRDRNLKDIADCIVGDRQYFPYKSSFYITQFFDECDLPYIHDGSTRWWWTAERLKELLKEPCVKDSLPEKFINLLRVLMYKSDATEDDPERINALIE